MKAMSQEEIQLEKARNEAEIGSKLVIETSLLDMCSNSERSHEWMLLRMRWKTDDSMTVVHLIRNALKKVADERHSDLSLCKVGSQTAQRCPESDKRFQIPFVLRL